MKAIEKRVIIALLVGGTLVGMLIAHFEYKDSLGNKINILKEENQYALDYWNRANQLLTFSLTLIEDPRLAEDSKRVILEQLFSLRKTDLIAGIGIYYYDSDSGENLYLKSDETFASLQPEVRYTPIPYPESAASSAPFRYITHQRWDDMDYLRFTQLFILENRVAGVILLDVKISEMNRMLQRDNLTQGSRLYLTDPRGENLLCYTDSKLIPTDEAYIPAPRWKYYYFKLPLNTPHGTYSM
ncbi:MAG: hypothetical protein PQJ60_02245, partial [Spirochaetales bacterium]|nr:hypothetical protein [Spirochaetales bacterium]